MALRPSTVLLAAATALVSALAAIPAVAQSLRGSHASVERMYREAHAERLSFFGTPRSVRRAVAKGWLVRLTSESSFSLHRVGYPYVRPATRTFVERLSTQYRAACGEELVVTSATRPANRQPGNSVAHSVHPTGMAVDLRRPEDGSCLRWLRRTLLALEGDGLLEATEEHAPAHFHVAIFPRPYARYAAAREKAESRTMVAARGPAPYTVRAGDTLWSIARSHETTVVAIQRANHLDDETLQPGESLRIPTGS